MNGIPAVLTATECEDCELPLFTGEVCMYHAQRDDGSITFFYLCGVCWQFAVKKGAAQLAESHHRAIARSVGYPNTKGGDNG